MFAKSLHTRAPLVFKSLLLLDLFQSHNVILSMIYNKWSVWSSPTLDQKDEYNESFSLLKWYKFLFVFDLNQKIQNKCSRGIEVLNAIKETSLEHFNVFSTTPRVDFKSPNPQRDVAALNALKRAILIWSQSLDLWFYHVVWKFKTLVVNFARPNFNFGQLWTKF